MGKIFGRRQQDYSLARSAPVLAGRDCTARRRAFREPSGATAQAERGLLCRAIDISQDTFTKVTPRFTNRGANPVDELRFLAHCRQVSTLDKEIQATKDDGWFSVLIGNRFPSPGPSPVV